MNSPANGRARTLRTGPKAIAHWYTIIPTSIRRRDSVTRLPTPCLQSKRKFNLSRCFGCAYEFEARLRLLQSCSDTAREVAGNSRMVILAAEVVAVSCFSLYGECMARMISTTIRLNEEDVRALKRARAAGHSASELLRKGLRVVASRYYTGRRPPSTMLFECTDSKLGDESELFRDLED